MMCYETQGEIKVTTMLLAEVCFIKQIDLVSLFCGWFISYKFKYSKLTYKVTELERDENAIIGFSPY